jgi:hypothetical protein
MFDRSKLMQWRQEKLLLAITQHASLCIVKNTNCRLGAIHQLSPDRRTVRVLLARLGPRLHIVQSAHRSAHGIHIHGDPAHRASPSS